MPMLFASTLNVSCGSWAAVRPSAVVLAKSIAYTKSLDWGAHRGGTEPRLCVFQGQGVLEKGWRDRLWTPLRLAGIRHLVEP